jgi:hypothetical protein
MLNSPYFKEYNEYNHQPKSSGNTRLFILYREVIHDTVVHRCLPQEVIRCLSGPLHLNGVEWLGQNGESLHVVVSRLRSSNSKRKIIYFVWIE